MEKLRNKLSIWLLMVVVRIANYRPKGWEVKTNGCFRTYTKRIFNLLEPKPDMIDIVDITKGLAYKPHFSGFSPKFFSIAEHSLLVEELAASYNQLDYKARLEALLHDASEAYTGDMIKPLKNLLPNFVIIEKNIQKAIYQKYGIKPNSVNAINTKKFDIRAQDIEAGIFYNKMDVGRKLVMQQYIKYYSPDESYKQFIEKFRWLTFKIKEQK